MSDTPVKDNTALKEALAITKRKSKRTEKDSVDPDARIPVNVPMSYRNKLKVMAAVEDTTMRALILEALDLLFRERDIK